MEFSFDNQAKGTTLFLANAIEYIGHILHGNCNDAFLNRCRYIISEFCINAVKHSGMPESLFRIYSGDGHLVIEKKDNGAPFFIRLPDTVITLPLADDIDIITLLEDDINKLRMQRLHEYGLRFFAEDGNPPLTGSRQNLQEHFGLIIISRAADSFIYNYNKEEQSNIFTAMLRL